VALKPVLLPLSWINGLFRPRGGKRLSVSRAEIEVLAEMGRREGILGEHESSVVTRAMSLRGVEVGEVMTPRTDIAAVQVQASVAEAMDLMLDEGHLRMPVYDGSLDHIVGVLAARDLWRAARSGETELRSVMRPITFAPVGKAVGDLISEMQEQRIRMVIVVDEFGGTSGLVTLEDLIEEIIGEIREEHEEDEPEDFQRLPDGGVLVRGDALVRDLNRFLLLDLPENEANRVGGFVFGRLGHVPRVGEEVRVKAGMLRVARVRGRRVERVLFVPRPIDAAASQPITGQS